MPTEQDALAAARAVKLSEQLRCLVCQNQTIADSNAELARRSAPPDPRADRRRQERRRDRRLHGRALRRLRAVPAAGQGDDGAAVGGSRAAAGRRLRGPRSPRARAARRTRGAAAHRRRARSRRAASRRQTAGRTWRDAVRAHCRGDGGRRSRLRARAVAQEQRRGRARARPPTSRSCATSSASSTPMSGPARCRAIVTNRRNRSSCSGRSKSRAPTTTWCAQRRNRRRGRRRSSAAPFPSRRCCSMSSSETTTPSRPSPPRHPRAREHKVTKQDIEGLAEKLAAKLKNGSRQRRRLGDACAHLPGARASRRCGARVRPRRGDPPRQRRSARRLRRLARYQGRFPRQDARAHRAGAQGRSLALEGAGARRYRCVRPQGLQVRSRVLGADEGDGSTHVSARGIDRCQHRRGSRAGRNQDDVGGHGGIHSAGRGGSHPTGYAAGDRRGNPAGNVIDGTRTLGYSGAGSGTGREGRRNGKARAGIREQGRADGYRLHFCARGRRTANAGRHSAQAG